MKIGIIGAGQVGSLTAMRVLQEAIGEVVLVDIIKGLAQARALDLEDQAGLLKQDYQIKGTEQIEEIQGSDILVITAGLTRKPGMKREDLLTKNAEILKEICLRIRTLAAEAIVIVVTNPLDIMTYYALKITGFSPNRVFGMGVSLDASRFINLISKELNISVADIDTYVLGSHGEGMLPLGRLTTIRGISLEEFLDEGKIERLVKRTIERGKEIVDLLGNGSAYLAPSLAITNLVKAIAKNEKRIIGVSAYLDGEYGLRDICIGVPCRIGRSGIEDIIELDLQPQEKQALLSSALSLREQLNNLKQCHG
ncbi:MAG: malate dehydrogenase [Candidatus Omnitrophica bacterium]|nr:malate dehydrogenase [Candidatus Omnitrophota bacterium]